MRYVLGLPSSPSAALSFGSSVHETLNEFYEVIKQGEKPSKRLMNKLLLSNWINEGYKSKKHETKMHERGKKVLGEYFQKSFNKNNLPLATEIPFVLPLADSSGKVLKIRGKIDRIDKLPNGKIEIIDFKTGEKVPSQSHVDKDLQLTFYALAATKIRDKYFNKKPKDIVLSLYYLDEGKKISTVRSKKDLANAEKEIFAIRKEIEESDFKCSGNYLCKNCEYKLMCQT